MSLSYQKLNVVEVRDPRTIVQNMRSYAILKSGSQTTWKYWSTTSVSNTSIQFSCPPPSGGILVDPKIYFYLPIRLTMTGIPPLGVTLLNPNYDAPRAFPISGSIETLQATINNQSVSINLADVIHCLTHFNTGMTLKNGDYSMTPNYPDQSQQYNDLLDNIRSPLQGYGDGLDECVMQRGGFPFTVVQNPPGTGPLGVVTAIVDMYFCEPLFLPPFYFGQQNRSGFFNVNSMDFNITFSGNMGYRMWSHNPTLAGPIASISTTIGGTGGLTPPFTQFSTLLQTPLMLIQYITPQETQILSPNMSITYPYFDIQRYPTQQTTGVSPGTAITLPSNNIQLSSIPRRLYIFVRDSNDSLYQSATYPDVFWRITGISIQFMNKNGLLASASMMQLYEMSKKNHCNLSWTQWSGEGVNVAGSFTAGPINTIGSILCIEFATDIGLDSLDAPGKLGQYQLQVNVNCQNISARTQSPTLYLVPILEGTFTIPSLGRALINIGVITSQDILNAKMSHYMNYNDVESVLGGDFFSGIKNFFSEHVLPALKEFVNNRGISKTLGKIPHPIAQTASQIAHAVGYGEGEGGVLLGAGGVSAGGRHMSKAQLKRRLRNY